MTTLTKAIELLEEKAWIQGAFGRDAAGFDLPEAELKEKAVCYCIMGALYAASDNGKDYALNKAYFNALQKIDEVIDDEYRGGIARWNDHPNRTKDEVIELLRKANNATV